MMQALCRRLNLPQRLLAIQRYFSYLGLAPFESLFDLLNIHNTFSALLIQLLKFLFRACFVVYVFLLVLFNILVHVVVTVVGGRNLYDLLLDLTLLPSV